jgi:hypothetical protein
VKNLEPMVRCGFLFSRQPENQSRLGTQIRESKKKNPRRRIFEAMKEEKAI